MSSIDAKAVAQKVSESIRKGKKVKLGEIIRATGYAISTSESPQIVTQTKSYQEEISPVVERWIRQRDRLTESLENKDLDKETLRDTMDAIDKLTKNIQLLTGGKTGNERLEISWE